MSCMLRISGVHLKIDEYLKLKSEPENYHRVGDPVFQTKPDGKKHESCYVGYCLSEADFEDFSGQQQDVIEYLKNHEKVFEHLLSVDGIEDKFLDFGIEKRDVVAQSDYFEPELVRLAAQFGLGIMMSQYLCDDDEEEPESAST